MAIVQVVAVPAQPVYVVNVRSLFLISIIYPVSTEPPSAGAVQVIETLLPEIAVVGADGVEGTVAVTRGVI